MTTICIVVIWVNIFQTELMVDIYSKKLVIGKVLGTHERDTTRSIVVIWVNFFQTELTEIYSKG